MEIFETRQKREEKRKKLGSDKSLFELTKRHELRILHHHQHTHTWARATFGSVSTSYDRCFLLKRTSVYVKLLAFFRGNIFHTKSFSTSIPKQTHIHTIYTHIVYICRANDFLRQVVSLCVFHVRQFYTAHTRELKREIHIRPNNWRSCQNSANILILVSIPLRRNSSTNSPPKRRLIWLKAKDEPLHTQKPFLTSIAVHSF